MDSGRHEICDEGVLDQRWSGWFGWPRITGPLTKTCDLHLPLARVHRVGPW